MRFKRKPVTNLAAGGYVPPAPIRPIKALMFAKYTITTLPIVREHVDIHSCMNGMEAKLLQAETDKELATCEIYFVDFVYGRAITDCHDLLDVDGVTYEFAPLFDEGFELLAPVVEKLDHFLPVYRLVIIHSLHVPPEHRGNKYSKVLIDDIERHFVRDTDLFALKAFPLDNNTPETTESLAQYYESIGFERAGVNDILVRPQI